MAKDALFSLCLAVLLCISTVPVSTYLAGAQEILGVNYGMKSDNLPAARDVVALFKANNIRRVRLFDPNTDALNALQDSGIEVMLGMLNQDISSVANDVVAACDWVQLHVIPYVGKVTFRYITVGNEVIPGDVANDVLPAMKNLQAALRAASINVPVSTAVSIAVLGSSYPPSTGSFSSEAVPVVAPIAEFLAANNAPFLLNVYPYIPYIGDPTDVPLNYALGTSTSPVVRDGSLSYFNLLDAMVDAVYAALEKVGAPGVKVVVAETGWPSGGGGGQTETIANAQTYNNFVASKVQEGKGTPKMPGNVLEAYLFAMFNEDLKPPGTEQHFGLFYPNMTSVYTVKF